MRGLRRAGEFPASPSPVPSGWGSLSSTRRNAMMTRWIQNPALLGLGVVATLVAAIVGCGGQATDSSDAVVVPDSSAVGSAPATKTGATPAAGAPAAATP